MEKETNLKFSEEYSGLCYNEECLSLKIVDITTKCVLFSRIFHILNLS